MMRFTVDARAFSDAMSKVSKVLLYRTVRHSKDYKGGYNHFITRSELEKCSYPHLLDTLRKLRKDQVDDERAA